MLLLAFVFLVALTAPASAEPISALIIGAIGLSGTAATIASAVITATLTAAASLGLSLITSKLFAPKAKKNTPSNLDSSINITTRESLAPRRIVYGRTRLGGTIAYLASSDNNSFLHLVIVFCDGPIDGYEAIYFNDTQVTIDAGIVTTEPYFSGGNAHATVSLYYGTDSQGADTILQSYLPSAWTEGHRLSGCAYMYVRLLWNANVFSTGLPNITAVIRGEKVYDPRTGQRAWSDNAALCIRDYLARPFAKGGVGAGPLELDDDNFIAQANICDEWVQLGDGTAERRYTLNGVIKMDSQNSPQATIESMLTSCAGKMVWTSGVFYLYVAAWRPPTASITDSILVAPLKIVPRRPLREQFNAIKGSFVNPAARYEPADYPARTSDVFEDEDGGVQIFKDLPLEFTQSSTMAQRLAKIELFRSREPITAQAVCNLYAYQIAVGDVVTFTRARLGWVDKTFEVTNWKWTVVREDDVPKLAIELSLEETSATVYDWSATDEQLLAAAPATNLPDWTNVGGIETLTLAAGSAELLMTGDGSIISRIKAAWSTSADAFVNRYEIRWKRNTDANFGVSVFVGIDDAPVYYISPVEDGQIYVVEVRAISVLGASSGWVTGTVLVLGKTQVPDDVASIRINGGILTWDYPDPPADLAGFKVRYQTGSYVFWGSGIEAHSGILTAGQLDVSALLYGTITLMVKAIDTSGNESVNPAVVVAKLGDHIVENVILDDDRRAAGFPGTITAGAVAGGDLTGLSTGLYWNTDPKARFWGANAALFWPVDTFSDILWSFTYMPTVDVAGSTLSLSTAITGAPWAIRYREAGASLYWPSDDGALFWPADTELFWPADDTTMKSWPGSVVVRRTQYDFEVYVNGGSLQPKITEFRMIFDVPDLIEVLGDVSIGVTSTQLPLTKAFRAVTAVQLTVQAGAGGAVTALTDAKGPSGVFVSTFNAAGAPVAALVDATVQGY